MVEEKNKIEQKAETTEHIYRQSITQANEFHKIHTSRITHLTTRL
jgi:hypothetical protein